MTWDKLFNFSDLDFVNCKNGNSAILAVFCEGEMGLNEKMYGMKLPVCQILALSAKSLNVMPGQSVKNPPLAFVSGHDFTICG